MLLENSENEETFLIYLFEWEQNFLPKWDTLIYKPLERCEDEEKEYCHKIEQVVVEEVCDMKFNTAYL